MDLLHSDWPSSGMKSPSTPQHTHKRADCFLAEVIMLNRGMEPVEFFWQKPEYIQSYRGFIIQLALHLKYAGFNPVCRAVFKNKLTDLSARSIDLIKEEILTTNNV